MNDETRRNDALPVTAEIMSADFISAAGTKYGHARIAGSDQTYLYATCRCDSFMFPVFGGMLEDDK